MDTIGGKPPPTLDRILMQELRQLWEGDADKINKRKDKLAQSRKDLQDAVEELDQ